MGKVRVGPVRTFAVRWKVLERTGGQVRGSGLDPDWTGLHWFSLVLRLLVSIQGKFMNFEKNSLIPGDFRFSSSHVCIIRLDLQLNWLKPANGCQNRFTMKTHKWNKKNLHFKWTSPDRVRTRRSGPRFRTDLAVQVLGFGPHPTELGPDFPVSRFVQSKENAV